MNLFPTADSLNTLILLPQLLDRPLWAVAPLANRKTPYPRLGLPREFFQWVAAATVTPWPAAGALAPLAVWASHVELSGQRGQLNQQAESQPEAVDLEDNAVPSNPWDAYAEALAAGGGASLLPGAPRYAFEEENFFPADTPIELLGAYVALVEAATRVGMKVRWAQLRPVTLEVWLDDGRDLAEIALYYGSSGSPLLARVLEASSEDMAAAAFNLLQSLRRPTAATQASGGVLQRTADLPVTFVAGTGHDTIFTLRDLRAWAGTSSSEDIGRAKDAVRLSALTSGKIPPREDFWVVDGVFSAISSSPELQQLTSLSVLHLVITSFEGATAAQFLEVLQQDPFLADILVFGFCGPGDSYLTLVVQLWPGRENYVPSRKILQRYLEEQHYYETYIVGVLPVFCKCLEHGEPEQVWRPFII